MTNTLLGACVGAAALACAACTSLNPFFNLKEPISTTPLPDLRKAMQDKLGDKSHEFAACSMKSTQSPKAMENSGPMTQVPSSVPSPTMTGDLLKILPKTLRKEAEQFQPFMNMLINWPPDRQRIELRDHLNALRTVATMAKQMHTELDVLLRQDEEKLSDFEKLYVHYNRAYFGSLQITDKPASARLPEQVSLTLTKEGFVDRNGHSWTFSGVSMDLTLGADQKRFSLHNASAVDSQTLASDSVRIFLEAWFDASFRVPADAKATGVTQANVLKSWEDTTVKALGLDSNASRDIATVAMNTETVVIVGVGELIRGVGPAGLNNETVAAGIETAAGVIAKKLVEHEMYCYFKAKAQVT